MGMVFVNGKMWVDTRAAEDNVAEDTCAVSGCYTGGYKG